MQLKCIDTDGRTVIDGPASHCVGVLLDFCSTVELDDLRKKLQAARERAVMDEKRFPMPAVPVPADPTPVEFPPGCEHGWNEEFDHPVVDDRR